TEATKPKAGERRTYVLAAIENSSPGNSIKTGSPDPIVFSVLSDKFIDTLITHKQPKLLTDNHAPLAYLMGLDPILQ
ncbi:MAG: fused MFS/spermidine synthase, partial [Paracoccaceae bacterium]